MLKYNLDSVETPKHLMIQGIPFYVDEQYRAVIPRSHCLIRKYEKLCSIFGRP